MHDYDHCILSLWVFGKKYFSSWNVDRWLRCRKAFPWSLIIQGLILKLKKSLCSLLPQGVHSVSLQSCACSIHLAGLHLRGVVHSSTTRGVSVGCHTYQSTATGQTRKCPGPIWHMIPSLLLQTDWHHFYLVLYVVLKKLYVKLPDADPGTPSRLNLLGPSVLSSLSSPGAPRIPSDPLRYRITHYQQF